MASTIKSERGNDILVDDLQYMYHRNGYNSDKSVIYWECTQRKQKSCKARLQTKSKDENYEFIKTYNEHNHAASKSAVEAENAVGKLKEARNFIYKRVSFKQHVACTGQQEKGRLRRMRFPFKTDFIHTDR